MVSSVLVNPPVRHLPARLPHLPATPWETFGLGPAAMDCIGFQTAGLNKSPPETGWAAISFGRSLATAMAHYWVGPVPCSASSETDQWFLLQLKTAYGLIRS